MTTLDHGPYGVTETGAAYTEAARSVIPAQPVIDTEWTVYTVNCGECGGRGGQDCHGGKWADCPYCTPVEDCALCGDVIDCTDREPDRLLVDGHPQTVCRTCWALEPGEEA